MTVVPVDPPTVVPPRVPVTVVPVDPPTVVPPPPRVPVTVVPVDRRPGAAEGAGDRGAGRSADRGAAEVPVTVVPVDPPTVVPPCRRACR